MENKIKVKGSALISTMEYLKIHHGDEGIDRVLNVLPKEDSEILSSKVFPSMWYPVRTFINLNKFIDREFGGGSLVLAKKMGRYGAEHDLKTIYKIFYKIGSPQFIIKRAAQVFSTYYSQGKLAAVESGDNFCKLHLTDFPIFDEVYFQRVSGWMEKTIELSGGNNCQVTVSIKDQTGQKLTEFLAKWE